MSGNSQKVISVALAGNPNSGKSSLFNILTGSHQHIGNYPGVTVEKKQGNASHGETRLFITDLPGTYSLTSYSQEEVLARRFLVEEAPDVVVNVLDATNLERNLYLTIQLLEMGANMVVALNMMDEVRKQKAELDVDLISSRLGCPVVETIGHHGAGLEALKEAIVEVAERGKTDTVIQYSDELGEEVEKICGHFSNYKQVPYHASFAAIKLLESDMEVMARFRRQTNYEPLFEQVRSGKTRLGKIYGNPTEILIGDRRYGFSAGLVREATLRKPEHDLYRITEKIDAVVTNRVLGLPIFGLAMYGIFWVTFTLGTPMMNLIEAGFRWLSGFLMTVLPESILRSVLVDGVIGGVGGVIVFLPNIVLLFLCISFLEDTGYMSRAAFIMDKIMHKIGLHGRSFIPMMIGFGCTVPAIMATRTIRSEKGRLTTMMILPLMSCGARLPIYLMIIPAFFPAAWHAPMLLLMYLIGVGLAFILALVLRKTLFSGDAEPFVMELPPYRMPTMKAIFRHMWDKSWMYLKKAGTIILTISLILWVLMTFPQKKTFDVDARIADGASISDVQAERERAVESLSYSLGGRLGQSIEPMVTPIGFDWKIATAFLGAFAAKEVFVSQMGIIYSIGEVDETSATLRNILRRKYSPLVGLCIMLFALIATPCVATIAATRKESGSWKWAALQWGGLTFLGWIVAFIVYQSAGLFLT